MQPFIKKVSPVVGLKIFFIVIFAAGDHE